MFVVVFNVYRIHEPCLLLKHSLSCFTFFLYIFESWVQMTKLQSFIRVTTLEFWVFSIRRGPDHPPPSFSKWFKSLRESKGSLPPSFLCIYNSDSHSKITNNSPTSTLNANKSHGPPPPTEPRKIMDPCLKEKLSRVFFSHKLNSSTYENVQISLTLAIPMH